MDKIVVFGGSFNPPTTAHLNLGLKAVEFVGAKTLCFLPVGDNYNKNSLINSKFRIEMLSILKEKHSNIDIDLTEVNSSKNLSSIESLNILQEKYKDCKIYFLIGADNLINLDKWERPEELLGRYNILAMRRSGFNIDDIIKENHLLNKHKASIITMDLDEDIFVSSTMVRELINTKEDISEYIDKDVLSYIRNNSLYKN